MGWVLGALSLACSNAEASRNKDLKEVGSTVSALVTADDAPPGSKARALIDKDEASLRRSYGVTDMKTHPCVTAQEDGAIVGKQCPSALVVFGPYVTVPANSDVQLRFDIEASTKVTIMSDVLSDGAKRFHGALDDEAIQPQQSRTVSYKIRVFDGVSALESRIGLRADAPVDFKITNLKLTID
jgi:hypothetical protein